ncbi:hypothetical protein [Algiphilus sp.]|nr:hypothetical protein [Algiphilus sp.]
MCEPTGLFMDDRLVKNSNALKWRYNCGCKAMFLAVISGEG